MNMKRDTDRPDAQAFVVDGYNRLENGIADELRPGVEETFAKEFDSAGVIKRWIIRRRIEQELSKQVAEHIAQISTESQF